MTSTSSTSSTKPASTIDEAVFLSNIEALKLIPLVFNDSYQAPPNLWPSRVPVLALEVLPPPEKKLATSAANLAEVLNVTFKSLKPAYSGVYGQSQATLPDAPISAATLPIQPADSIQSLKGLITSQTSSPLAGSTVRLLLKGKALQDTKLVKDYEIKDGSTITVMASKPTTAAAQPDASATSMETSSTPSYTMDLTAADRDPVPAATSPNLGASTPGMGHKRRISDIPAVTLSPAGTPAATTPLLQPISLSADPLSHIPLTPSSPKNSSSSGSNKGASVPLDLASIPIQMASSQHDDSPYHQTMANPQFWQDLRTFLEGKFGKDAGGRTGDPDAAFEEFLRSAKVSLSPHEIAKIRDQVGISGMGGH